MGTSATSSKTKTVSASTGGASAPGRAGGHIMPARRYGSALYPLVWVVMEALFALVHLVLALFAATNLVPRIVVLVQNGSGITLDDIPELVVAGWLLPSLFLIALLFVLVLFLCRAIRAAHTRLRGAVRGALVHEKSVPDGE